MSTTFGIYKGKDELIYDGCLENIDDDYIEENFIEVAFQGSYNRWTNPLAEFLSDDIKIYALDNSTSDIFTIGDFRKTIEEE